MKYVIIFFNPTACPISFLSEGLERWYGLFTLGLPWNVMGFIIWCRRSRFCRKLPRNDASYYAPSSTSSLGRTLVLHTPVVVRREHRRSSITVASA